MRIGLISDIHEDINSLNQALEFLKNENVETILCLGDILGFSIPFYNDYYNSRDGKACIETIKKNCKISVAGNHDLFAAKKPPKYNNKFAYPENWYELSPDERKKMSKNKIWYYEDNELVSNAGIKQLIFIQELCEYEKLITNDISIFLSHFIYPDLSGSCIQHPKSKRFYRKHIKFMELNNCQVSFSGHGHYEGIAVGSKKFFKVFPFGNYKLDILPVSISLPCIAGANIENGITIFNSETYELNVIPLRKSFNRNSKYETIR